MTTKYYEVIPFARIFLGDLTSTPTYHDDIIAMVLRGTTAFLSLLGYGGHTSNYHEITPTLTEVEKSLWGKAAAVLIRNPKALETASSAVSIRTEEVSYSTEQAGELVRSLSATDMRELMTMIMRSSDPMVASSADFGMQLGESSPYKGLDSNRD